MSGTIHLTLKTKCIMNENCRENEIVVISSSTRLSKQQTSWKRSCIIDELHSMCKQELAVGYNCPDHSLLLQKSRSNTASSINAKGTNSVEQSCREKIVAWCYRVIDYFGLRRDTVYVAMSYLDRFTYLHSMERCTYKLAATTALLLAIKIHQPKQINLKHTIKDFSNGQFDYEDVIRMELIMLRSLAWKMHPPSPFDFILRFITLHSFASRRIHEFDLENLKNMAVFFVELSVWDFSLSSMRPSIVAVSATLNAMEHLGLLCQVSCCLEQKVGNDLSDGNKNRGSIMDFVEMMLVTLHVKNCGRDISKVRRRLKRLYEQSEEYMNNIKARHRLEQKQIQVASNFASIYRFSNNGGKVVRHKKKSKDHVRLGDKEIGSPKSIV